MDVRKPADGHKALDYSAGNEIYQSQDKMLRVKHSSIMYWRILLFVAVVMGCSNQSLPPPADMPEKEGISADVPDKEHEVETLLFEELFEDTNWSTRGWYDNPKMQITSSEHISGSGHSCVWHWQKAGDIGVVGRGGRALFKPVTNVTLSFHIKHSANWEWTGVNWHPHEFHFLTDVDPPFIGPAYTHLTFYVEVVNGVPRAAIQDGKNIDESRIGQNLVGLTENRAVSGCNGDSDGHGKGTCYRSGNVHWNGKYWEPGRIYFSDEPGPYYKGDWHHVKVKFQLNSVVDGIGLKDGVLQYWFDGKLIMDYHDIVFRTGQHPDMKINQFLMAPYFGTGVPHEQRIWIDDLRIYTSDTQGN